VSRHRSIRFPDDLDQWIEREAERLDRNYSWVVSHEMQMKRAREVVDMDRKAVEAIAPTIEQMESRYPEDVIARAVLSALGAAGMMVVRADGAVGVSEEGT
jgi:hypothetical protein